MMHHAVVVVPSFIQAGTIGSDNKMEFPGVLPLSVEYIDQRGCYLLDNGREMVIWIGSMIDASFMSSVFGVDANHQDYDSTQVRGGEGREGNAANKAQAYNVLYM